MSSQLICTKLIERSHHKKSIIKSTTSISSENVLSPMKALNALDVDLFSFRRIRRIFSCEKFTTGVVIFRGFCIKRNNRLISSLADVENANSFTLIFSDAKTNNTFSSQAFMRYLKPGAVLLERPTTSG